MTEILLKVELNTININRIVVEITYWDLLQIPDINIIYWRHPQFKKKTLYVWYRRLN